MISSTEALARVALTKDEERALAKLEAVVDGMIRSDKFDGAPLIMQFNEQVAPKIAHALQRDYERGGWRATVTPGAKLTVQLVPTMAVVAAFVAESSLPTTRLPPLAQAQPQLSASKRLLVRMPTRGRPAQALSVLQKYRDLAGCEIQLEVVIDEDDETMLDVCVQQRLLALDCTITVGAHKSKVEACNGGRLEDWDILLLASDDMVPTATGYATRVIAAMEQHWPHLDGALYFDDGMQHETICTLPIMGKRWWKQCGNVVYSPAYQSLFCDTEQTDLWRAQGRLCYVDEKIIEHRHHAWGKADNDALYQRNDALWKADEAVYEQRKRVQRAYAQWAFDQPSLLLSILICTVPERRAKLDRLLDHLWAQIDRLDVDRRSVEICVDGDDGTIGAKRQRLLERARGHFIAYCDDDDYVSHDYLQRTLSAITGNSDADCLSLRGVMTTAGEVPEPFYHSIHNTEWCTRDGVHLREPNHLNVVRRDLALEVGFKPMQHGEDVDFGKRLRPLLKTEADLGDAPAYYYLYAPVK